MADVEFEEFEPERLVKSTDRVRDLGEVYTPANIVDDMLDLLPLKVWSVHPTQTFLEPSVGNGNFVSAILSRKLTVVDDAYRTQNLADGSKPQSALFHALEALSSIYGVDISEDNIIGGTPGHEIACRPRLLSIMERWHTNLFSSVPAAASDFMKSARWIVEHNMLIGNMLAREADGKPTGREEIILIDYVWEPPKEVVTVFKTNLGAVMAEAEEKRGDVLSLFGPEPAVEIWSGPYTELYKAETFSNLQLTGKKSSNSRGGNR